MMSTARRTCAFYNATKRCRCNTVIGKKSTITSYFVISTTNNDCINRIIVPQKDVLMMSSSSLSLTSTTTVVCKYYSTSTIISHQSTINTGPTSSIPKLSNYSIDTNSMEYKQSIHRTTEQVQELNQRLDIVYQGGGPVAVERHKQRNKALPRDRINKLVDPGTAVLELSPLAGYDVNSKDNIPSGGIITAIGSVSGQQCMIIANDATVKGGTYFPITVKKHLRAQEIAMDNKLPCIYIVDSGGAYLPKQSQVFPDKYHFGRIFYNQATMSASGVPQIAVVCGSCTAGGAYVPSMSDETIIVQGNGTIFLGGPPLVRAATGEIVTAEELGGAITHTSISGVADHLATNEDDAIIKTRSIIANLGLAGNAAVSMPPTSDTYEEPLFDPVELGGIIPIDSKKSLDMRYIIARIVDGSRFHEFKSNYGTTLITGFASIMGQSVGIIANNGILFSESSMKGSHFIQLCCQRGIPIVFIQNISGFMIGSKYEQEGIAKHGAKLVTAVATATVPKITLIVGGSYGAGNYAMCGRAYSPRFLFMWPNAKIAVMGGEQAAMVLTTVQRESLEKKGTVLSIDDECKLREPILQQFDYESSAYYSTSHLWDDGIIEPASTRIILGHALRIACRVGCTPSNTTKFGIFRM